MSAAANADQTPKARSRGGEGAILRWLAYCVGVCLELLGMAFTGAVVVVFFGQVDSRILLSLTAVGVILFYSGWLCVRQGSRRSATATKGGDDDARRARTGASEAASSPREGSQGSP
jgi:uncharacterized membrane protein